MPAVPKHELLQTEIGGKTLQEWDLQWKPLRTAFSAPQPDLRYVVGLFRVRHNGAVKYIARATEPVGGLAKGLARIRGPAQTGNAGYGAKMIQKHLAGVSVDVLKAGEGVKASENTKELKKAMIKFYDPEWTWPFQRRMKAIQSGELPAD